MSDIRLLGRRYGFGVVVGLAALESALEVAFRHDSARAPRSPVWFAVPAIVLVFVPLLARGRAAFAAAASVWIVAAAISFVDGRLIVFPPAAVLAGMAAALLFGNLRDDFQGRLGLLVVVSAAAIVAYNDPSHTPGEFVFLPVLFTVCWTIGLAFRARSAQADAAEGRALQAERVRETTARIAVAEERARIARELHDIVAHSMSVMVLQVGAVRHDLPDALTQDKDALKDVEQVGRAALAEMRRLLGAMRREMDDVEFAPQPGLSMLELLLDDVRRAGLQVDLQIEGDPVDVPRALDLSAYRIIQEGLTNVLKHAHATQADVHVAYTPDRLQIAVRDNGRGSPTDRGLSHGLLGIEERVKIYGGQMQAGRANGTGFLLSAWLPLDGDER